MRTIRIAAAAGLAAALAAGLRAEDERKGPSDKVKAFLGGEANVGVIAGATRVEVFRVFPEKPSEPMGRECAGYPVISSGKERDREFAAKLAAVLFDEKTYDFEKAGKEKFEPAIGFRLWRDKDWIDLVLAFGCDELELSWRSADRRETHTAHEDFAAARATLVKLCREAFPDDKEVQGLEEKRK